MAEELYYMRLAAAGDEAFRIEATRRFIATHFGFADPHAQDQVLEPYFVEDAARTEVVILGERRVRGGSLVIPVSQ